MESNSIEALIPKVTESFQATARADTKVTIDELDILEQMNRDATEKYLQIYDKASKITENQSAIIEMNNEIKGYINEVNDIEIFVNELEGIVSELEEWSQELDIKIRRQYKK